MKSETNVTASLLATNEGQLFNVLGASFFLKTTSAQSDGQWFVLENTAPPRFSGPGPHFHKVVTEIFVILEGEMTLTVGEQTRTVGPGGYAYIPPGTVHTFSNETDAPVKYLGIASPAIMEGYFHEVMTLVQSGQWPPRDMGEITALMEKYDSFLKH